MSVDTLKVDQLRKIKEGKKYEITITYGEGGEPGEETLQFTESWVTTYDGQVEVIGTFPDKKKWLSLAMTTGTSDAPRQVEINRFTGLMGSREVVRPSLENIEGTVEGLVNGQNFARCTSFSFRAQTRLGQQVHVNGVFDVETTKD
ncbi:hypothetical protein F7234_11090 [Pseudomonas putida]|uniref:hypothetical protein n=1 Tax=Pseudomonas putida TaxID=303 RepID=UPI00125F4A7F|nr:hypothetical protein [Pseudomonas putida]KAB5624386.1 hypothetical protein F7234_11090 [Pseudomonas putida]